MAGEGRIVKPRGSAIGARMSLIPADDCTDMSQVRAAIDALDGEIVALLGRRMRYIEAAARIKQARGDVRDEARKAEVIANARAAAIEAGFPDGLTAALFEMLVEGSIAHEYEAFDAR